MAWLLLCFLLAVASSALTSQLGLPTHLLPNPPNIHGGST
jgi:hypothetical protein